MPGYHLPWFAAADRGIYQRHGLEVEIVDPFPGPDNARAVSRGVYDACLTSVAHFVRAHAQTPGLGARFVFMVARRTHMAAFAVAGRSASHGREVGAAADLDGASFGGERDSPFVREHLAFLRRLGLAPGARVDMPYEQTMEALAAGRIDVAVDFADLLPRFAAAARPYGVDLRVLRYADDLPAVYGSGIVASTRLLDERPEVAVGLVRAAKEGLALSHGEPAAGLAALRRRLPDVDPAYALDGWQAGEPAIFGAGELGTMDRATWERTLAHQAEAQDVPTIDPALAFDPRPLAAAARRATAGAATSA